MRVGFVLYHRALITGISLAAEMLSSASTLRERRLQKESPFSLKIVAPTLTSPKLTAGIRIEPDVTFNDEEQFDLVIFVWLAETGLLNDQVATTHWYFYDKFSQRYPKIKLNRQASITAANGLYCTGSINSQTEMILYIIEKYYGQKIATTIETHYGHEISKSGQQPFYQIGGQAQFDESIALAQEWMKRHLSESITATDIANACRLPLGKPRISTYRG